MFEILKRLSLEPEILKILKKWLSLKSGESSKFYILHLKSGGFGTYLKHPERYIEKYLKYKKFNLSTYT